MDAPRRPSETDPAAAVDNPYWLQALQNDLEHAQDLLSSSSSSGGSRGGSGLLVSCLALLRQPGAATALPGGNWEQGAAVCEVLLAAADRDWAGVLRLHGSCSAAGAPSRGPAAVRSQARVLSRLVHPDKCRWPRAEEAFRAVQAAAAQGLLGGDASVGRAEDETGEEQGGEGEEWWRDVEERRREERPQDPEAKEDEEALLRLSVEVRRGGSLLFISQPLFVHPCRPRGGRLPNRQ